MLKKEKLPQDITILQQMLLQQSALNETLQKTLQNQTESTLTLHQSLRSQKQTIEKLELMITGLQQQIETLLRQLYGKKSERLLKATAHEEAPDKTVETPAPGNPQKENKARGRQKLPNHLQRQRVLHDLPEANKNCDHCGGHLHKMGEETSEQYDYVPAKLIVLEHVRPKYVCRPCGGNIKMASMPFQAIDKGLASPGLLAQVLIDKYEDALPLYRQEKRWKRLGVELSRSTLCAWVAGCARMLEPLVSYMKIKNLLLSPKIHVDDTPVGVQTKGLRKMHTGRLWVFVGGGGDGPGCTIYHYSSNRTQEVCRNFLGNYKGYLQADAYGGYDCLYESGDIIECACWAHCRRKFFDITQAVKAPSLADEALDFIGKLYDIERLTQEWSNAKRKAYRRRYAKPILKKFKRWLNQKRKITLPKSPIGNAIAYTQNHWRALGHYLREGYLSIDNNAAERAIKPLVIGRKNYLFFGSHEGGKYAAIIYSLIETCKQHDINTFDYLKDILTRLPSQKMSQIQDLLPYNWKSQQEAISQKNEPP